MHWFTNSVLVTILCVFWQDSEATTNSINKTVWYDGDENNLQTGTPELNTTNLIPPPENNTEESKTNIKVGSDEKQLENIAFNEIKPLLLFPILPFLFPPKEDVTSKKDEFPLVKNQTSKIEDRNSSDGKPFILLDFAFNIRHIPIKNTSNDSSIINIQKLDGHSELDSMKNRSRRNIKMETPGFFDDTPFFPDSGLEEFLPKPDLFFPDLPFHHRPAEKLSRRKRDHKKMELKNDLKSFFDAFDEAFMRTKREFEWTDPFVNFLRGGEQPFEEEKKSEDDLFGPITEIRKKPSVKWRMQRNIKELNNRQDGLSKIGNSPTIIVDKVVKIGTFHVHDDEDKKKREMKIDDDTTIAKNNEIIPKTIFELLNKEERKMRKRNYPKNPKPEESTQNKRQSEQSSSQMNAAFFLEDTKDTTKANNVDTTENLENLEMNGTGKLPTLMKVFDSLKTKMQLDLENLASSKLASKNRPHISKSIESKKLLQRDLKRNLTELLKQFLAINKKLEVAKEVDKLEVDPKVIDLTQKEIPTSNDPKVRRQKKDAYFENDYKATEANERRIANLNSLFLHVTLPTLVVFALVLLACFYSLQTRGKICTKLFRPRQVLIINDEATTPLKSPGTKKLQSI